MNNDYLQTEEAAKLLGFTPQWLRYLARLGRVPAMKPYPGARKYLFKRSDIENLKVSAAIQGGNMFEIFGIGKEERKEFLTALVGTVAVMACVYVFAWVSYVFAPSYYGW